MAFRLSRPMTLLLGILAALLAGSVALPFFQRATPPPALPRPVLPTTPRPRPPEPPILTVPVREMRGLVRDDALLKPDRRFLLAFEDVVRFSGRTPTPQVSVESHDRRWKVSLGAERAVSLSSIPGFTETLDALRQVAGRPQPVRNAHLSIAEQRQLIALASDPFERRALLALEQLDRMWVSATDHAALIDIASAAFVTLECERVDALDLADAISGRALALLALAEAGSGKRLPEREALLAYFLGYRGEAKSLAGQLDKTDARRLFIEESEAALAAAASSPASSRLARYLYALRLAENGKDGEVESWLTSHGISGDVTDPGIVAIRLHSRAAHFDEAVAINTDLLRLALREVGIGNPAPGMVPQFERALLSRSPTRGTLFDPALKTAQTRATFFSALYGMGTFYLDRLSSGPASSGFIGWLEGAETGPGLDFKNWFEHLVAEKNGEIKTARLVQDLNPSTTLGQAAFRRIGLRVQDQLPATSPERFSAAAALERILDSRPANRYLFCLVCLHPLLSPVAAEEYYRANLETAGAGRDLNPWLADRLGDVARLEAIAFDATADPETRLQALQHLDNKTLISGEKLRTSLLDVLAHAPKDGTFMGCVRLLWEREYLNDAERVLKRWDEDHADEHPLTRALYASRLTHVLFLKGRFADAWQTIEPYIQTGKGDALWAGAEALEGIGRHDEALAMSKAQVDRYPDNDWSRAELSQILWWQGRNDEAPRPLLDSRHPLGPYTWGTVVALRFHEVFARRESVEILKAFDGLIRAGVNPWYLFQFGYPFVRAGRQDVALALLDAVATAKNETIDGYLYAYRIRREWLGAEKAAEWFHEKVVPSKSASWVEEVAFDRREFELLWLLPDSDRIWLLRAEAAAFEGGPDAAHRQQLVDHFRNARTPPASALYGLYLLGLESDDRLFESASNPQTRCEVAYLMGLKAAGERRMVEAADWLRAALRTGAASAPDYKRSQELLGRWDTRRFGVRGGANLP